MTDLVSVLCLFVVNLFVVNLFVGGSEYCSLSFSVDSPPTSDSVFVPGYCFVLGRFLSVSVSCS